MKRINLCAFSDEAEDTIWGQINALKRNKISLMELRNLDKKNVMDLDLIECKMYSNILKQEGIKVWSIGSPLGKVDIKINFNEYTDKIKYICEKANVFETDKIRVFSFFNAYNEKNKVIDYLSKMVEISKQYKVKVYHENEKEVYGDNIERVLELKNQVKDLHFIYDPANFIQVGVCFKESSRILPYIDYYHVKDVIEKSNQIVPAGEGDGKIEEILCQVDGEKTFTIEPHLSLFSGYNQIDNSVLNNKYKFKNNNESFDCAIRSFKQLMDKNHINYL